MIQYHPAPEVLTDYAAGAMRLSHALCVASHLEYCAACRKAVSTLTAVGTYYFAEEKSQQNIVRQQLNEQQTLGQMKASVLGMLDSLGKDTETATDAQSPSINNAMRSAEFTVPVKKSGSAVSYKTPVSLGQFIGDSYDDLKWVSLSPSIKLAVLCRDKDGSQVTLTRVKAGGKMPHHAHTGEEITVVLEGAFSDESGLYKKGDMISRNAADKHRPVVTKHAECICLSVLDSPIQFTGFFTRWLNPFVRSQHT